MTDNSKRRFVNLLPANMRSEDLTKFFGATVDHVFQPGKSESLTGYIGRFPSYYDETKDFYIPEYDADRAFYQLEATMVQGDTAIDRVLFYSDLVSYVRASGGVTDNHDRLFGGEYYSWAPPIDIDKLVNPQQYSWFGGDPLRIPVIVLTAPLRSVVGNGYTVQFELPDAIDGIEEGDEFPVVFVDNLRVNSFTRTGPDHIQLSVPPEDGAVIDIYRYGDLARMIEGQEQYDPTTFFNTTATLSVNGLRELVSVPTAITSGMRLQLDDGLRRVPGWDTVGWDMNEWDALGNQSFIVDGVGFSITLLAFDDSYRGINPIYVLIARQAVNQNPWSRNNFWVHRSSYAWSGMTFPDLSAKRPIVEFLPDIELRNYGRQFTGFIDGYVTSGDYGWDTQPWDTDQWDNATTIEPIRGITVADGNLQAGQRILIARDVEGRPDLSHCIAVVTEGLNTEGETIFVLVPEPPAEVGDIVSVRRLGAEFHFTGTVWQRSQEFSNTTPPKFNIYDREFVRLDDAGIYPESNFDGSLIFGYAEGSTQDAVLGRAVRHDSLGQFVFENYLTTDAFAYRDGPISGMSFYRRQRADQDVYESDWHLAADETRQTLDLDHFSIPSNLQANPNNEEVDIITRNEWFDHFDSILSNQDGFEGETYGQNNYRDTARDRSRGTRIVQHRASLLKTMLLASDKNFDYMDAVRYVEHEYSRFRNRFVQQIMTMIDAGSIDSTVSVSAWLPSVLEALKLNKTADFPFALSRVGGGQNFIPPTPAALGILPSTPPVEMFDSSTGMTVLRGHDGSRLPVYGERRTFEWDGASDKKFILDQETHSPVEVRVNGVLLTSSQFTRSGRMVEVLSAIGGERIVTISVIDPRDAGMLALETLIYNNIPSKVRGQSVSVNLDRYSYGAFRNTGIGYSADEINAILQPMFIRWAQINGLDYRNNATYEEFDPFTWNYSSTQDRYGNALPGNWRAIYRRFFDTDRPHTDPWEMLGFAFKPDWWEGEYGTAPYTRDNADLWADLRDGMIRHGERAGIDDLYARPDLLSILPVSEDGSLLDPMAAQIVPMQPTRQQGMREWKFGDGAPVEALWRNTPSYRFSVARLGYLLKPARWIESNWDTANTEIVNTQTIDIRTGERPRNANLIQHGDIDSSGARVSVDGIQQWIVEHMISKGQDSTILTNAVRSVGVRLGHRVGGFTSNSNLRVTADNFGLVPQEDINIVLYNSPTAREEFYSGVLVEWTGTGWRVIGYDGTNPSFKIIPGDEHGPSTMITLAETPEAIILEWKPNIYYKADTLVDYKGSIYSCLRAHMSSQVFEASFWDARPDIRRPEAARVAHYTLPMDEILAVPYGTEFSTYQEIADFLLGYERYLVSRGWVFEEQDENEVQDWTQATKEFLQWAQASWAPGNFIALSPAADKLTFRTDHGTIYSMEESFNGVYGIVNRVGMPIDRRDTFVSRLDGEVNITVRDNDLFGVRLTVGEVEHAFIFSNETIFNDLIYRPLFDLRQPRLKVIGEVASDWNGRLDAPGFIVSDNDLKPNFDKAAEDIRTMFDIEGADSKTLRSYARHTVGFEERSYMENLMLSDTQQFEFYQGMVQQKGAPGVFSKLLRSQFISQARELRFLEEWAFKEGDYGAANLTERVSFDLFQSNIRRNPQHIVFSNTETSANDRTVVGSSSKNKFIHTPANMEAVFPVRSSYASLPDDLPTAGYVRRTEVDHAFFDIAAMDKYFGEALITGGGFGANQKVWLYNTPNMTFDVVKLMDSATIRAVEPGENARVHFEGSTLFTNADVGLDILINGETNASPDIGGMRKIVAVGPGYIEIDMTVTRGILYGELLEDDPIEFENLKEADGEPLSILALRTMRAKAGEAFSKPWFATGDIVYLPPNPTTGWTVTRLTDDGSTLVRRQPRKIDTTRIVSSLVYDRETKVSQSSMMPEPLVLDHLLVYDPVVGSISGLAERELSFKLDYDPARYDDGATWSSGQLGCLWWDVSRVRFLEAETNTLDSAGVELAHRISNWGKIAPGSEIAVYEWTRSLSPPSQWADGEVLNPEEPRWVEVQEFEPKLSRLVTAYYFWVKNRTDKVTYPGRKLDTQAVARLLENPTASNVAWLAPVTSSSMLVSGISGYLNDASTVVQLEVRRRRHEGVRHSEWSLLRANDERSMPADKLWNKMVDSISGLDALNQMVPDQNLHVSMRHGVGLRPRQSMFVGQGDVRRSIIAARESFVNMINIILARTNISQERPLFVDAMDSSQPISETLWWSSEMSVDVQAPPSSPREITHTVFSIAERDRLFMSPSFHVSGEIRRVLVNQMTSDKPQWSVWQYDPADGALLTMSQRRMAANDLFTLAPVANKIFASVEEMQTTTNQSGELLLVKPTSGPWSLWYKRIGGFDLIRMQEYRLNDFWSYADWYADGYAKENPPIITYASVAARNAGENPSPRTKFVRVNDDGTGSWIWTAFIDNSWVTVAREKGTIALSPTFYSTTALPYGDYDLASFSKRDGGLELRVIATILRQHLTDAEINELFFSMVHFAHSHLDQVTWAFKTSFLYIAGYNETVSQTPVQINDGTESLLAYIEEVKPYRVKTRDFARTLNPETEVANIKVSDFDRPPYWDAERGVYRALRLTSPSDLEIIQTQEPWKSWYANHQKPYRVWKRLSDTTRVPGVDYDPTYGFDEINPIRRFRTTMRFNRISGQITHGGETFDGSTLSNDNVDIVLDGDGSDHMVSGGAVLNAADQDRPEELVRVQNRDVISITVRTPGEPTIKMTALKPLASMMTPVRIGGWETKPWDTDEWDFGTGFLEVLPVIQGEAQDYRWALLPGDQDHVAKPLHTMEGGWLFLRYEDDNVAVLAEPVSLDDTSAEIEVTAGQPDFAQPDQDAPGVALIGNEQVEYTGLEVDGASVVMSGLRRGLNLSRKAKVVTRTTSTLADGDLNTFILQGASSLVNLNVILVGGSGANYVRQPLELGRDFEASVVGANVEIVMPSAPPEDYTVIISQRVSENHPAATRVLNSMVNFEPPARKTLNGEDLPPVWFVE